MAEIAQSINFYVAMFQVNVLEPHPHIPVLATSGLDDDIKIWVPTCEEDPLLPNLEQVCKIKFDIGNCSSLVVSCCSVVLLSPLYVSEGEEIQKKLSH